MRSPARDSPVAPPLSVYVHLPWCVRKCPYCDFNSHAHDGDLPERRYVDALLADLDGELADVWGRRVRSVFIGGGTPSLFAPRSIERLLSGLRARLNLHPHTEITLEANPGAADSARFEGFVAAGVNRLSIGVQSFDDASLQALGRIHDAAAAQRAVTAALSSGASSVNVDLMFGLPQQSLDAAMSDLATACASGAGHVSYYQLTLEPNTAFYRSPPPLPSHDRVFEIHTSGLQRLRHAGYSRYEVSAFARDGERCRHNLNYWQFGDYLGIGAGAHGKLTDARTGRIRRRIKQRSPQRYMDSALDGHALLSERDVTHDDRIFEFLLNALRLVEGFTFDIFEQRTGLERDVLSDRLRAAQTDGLLCIDDESVRCTERGARFLDEILTRFVPDDAND